MQTSPNAVVYLVGAGPGDPGLISVAGAQALARADVVVYDYLANKRLLDLAPAGAERVYVGKSSNQHTMTQDQINAVLVEKAGSQKPEARNQKEWVVVRLKGGDPYVFGRGGEEGEYLRAHGVRFVEIPGITSGIAGPAYAGIPVTHRDFTSTITLITGHEKEGVEDADSRVNYEALAKLNGTLVFYMGVKSLPQITRRLMDAGMAADMPAAVVRWGTHPHQRAVTGTVGTIAAVVEKAKITAPAITIVGQVVTLRDTLNWFENRPLFGQRVLVTRTRQQASELTSGLCELGAQVIEAPTIELAEPEDWAPIDAALGRLNTYDWLVFTSANGVRAAWERLRRLGLDARALGQCKNVAAIGPATAEALHAIGIHPDLIPEKFVGEELAIALADRIKNLRGARMLLLRADIARPVLRDELLKAGATVEDLPIYRTTLPAALPDEVVAALAAGEIDWITFTSASTAANLHALLPADLRQKVSAAKKLSIGPITTAAMNQLGWKPTLEAAVHDIGGMVAAITQAFQK